MAKKNKIHIYKTHTIDGFTLGKEKSCVYLIYDKNEKVSYVGQTRNIFSRLQQHFMDGKEIGKIVFHEVDEDKLCDAEAYYIRTEKPYLNASIPFCSRKSSKDIIKNDISLKEFLYENRLTISEFSRQINYCRGLIQGYISGKVRLSRKAAIGISIATDGCVTCSKILSDNPPLQKQKKQKSDKERRKENVEILLKAISQGKIKDEHLKKEYLSEPELKKLFEMEKIIPCRTNYRIQDILEKNNLQISGGK